MLLDWRMPGKNGEEFRGDRLADEASSVAMVAGYVALGAAVLVGRSLLDVAGDQTPVRLVLHRRVFRVARRPRHRRYGEPLASRARPGLATPVGRGGGDAETGVED